MVNFHLDWYDKNKRAQQVEQIITYSSKYEYVMMLGDYNPDNYLDGIRQGEPLYKEEWGAIASRGYNIANGGSYGFFVTFLNDDIPFPCDNIFVSKNISIDNVWIIDRPWMNDHRPICATLTIN